MQPWPTCNLHTALAHLQLQPTALAHLQLPPWPTYSPQPWCTYSYSPQPWPTYSYSPQPWPTYPGPWLSDTGGNIIQYSYRPHISQNRTLSCSAPGIITLPGEGPRATAR